MNNVYMRKQPRSSAPSVKSPNAVPKSSKGTIAVPKGRSSAPAKAKPVGRRVSQHKRMAMGEDIDCDND